MSEGKQKPVKRKPFMKRIMVHFGSFSISFRLCNYNPDMRPTKIIKFLGIKIDEFHH